MEPTWTMRRIALATLTVLASIGLAWALYQVRDSLIIVFVGILFGMAMKGPVVALQELYIPRWLALILVLIVVLAVLPLAVILLLPTLVNAITSVGISVIRGYETLLSSLTRPSFPFALPSLSLDTVTQNLVALLTSNSERLVGSALGVGTTIVGTLVNLITIITIGFLWLLEEERIRAWLINLAPPASQDRAQRIWQAVEAQVGGYLRGLLVLSVIVGLISAVGYGVIGLPLALAFGMLAGLMEIIPIPGVGLTLQVIIVGLATLSTSTSSVAIGAVIWTVIVFQAANMILFPRIMGNAVGISALGVIVALLLFVSLLGGVGALLAIPLASLIQIIVDQTVTHSRGSAPVPNGAVGTVALPLPGAQAELLRVRDLLTADTTLSPVERGVALEHVEAALKAVEPLPSPAGPPPPGRRV